MDEKRETVVFTNYTSSFLYFNDKYVELCIKLSETMSLRKVRRLISGFIYEFSYAIPGKGDWYRYKKRLRDINYSVNNDAEMNRVLEKDEIDFREQVKYYGVYYNYFLQYLNLLSDFVSELSATYLPRTKTQRSLLKFRSEVPFYEKLHEFKKHLFDNVSDFRIEEFRHRFNLFVTFFYAYKLFVSETYCRKIEDMLSNVLSIFVSEYSVNLLAKYPDYTTDQLRQIYHLESLLQDGILHCNELINKSLSAVDVLPKIRPRKYKDTHLI